MAALAGILNQQAAARAAMTKAAPMDSSTPATGSSDSSSSSSSDSATISANDFLTLLVTEMQNQDPTADTDPNEYINQLVQVNSLEQLININQTLTGAFDPSTSTDTPQSSNDATNPHSSVVPQTSAAVNSKTAALAGTPAAAAHAPGNLSVPSTTAAANRVGQSLNGHTPAHRANQTPANNAAAKNPAAKKMTGAI